MRLRPTTAADMERVNEETNGFTTARKKTTSLVERYYSVFLLYTGYINTSTYPLNHLSRSPIIVYTRSSLNHRAQIARVCNIFDNIVTC